MSNKAHDLGDLMGRHPVPSFAIVMLAIASIGIGWWVTQSHFEAVAYNRLTGAHATTWDAMWVELRVMGQPQ